MSWIQRRPPTGDSPDNPPHPESVSPYDPTYLPTERDATLVPTERDATLVPTQRDATYVPTQHGGAPESAHRDPQPAKTGGSTRWRVGAWDQPDLRYANAFASSRYRNWPLYIPQLELVPCGDLVKPALFFKVGSTEFSDWSTTVEPRSTGWNWLQTKGDKPYVLLELSILFENTSGSGIGLGGAGRLTHTTLADLDHAHRLRCTTMLDPADQRHREAVEAWAHAPSPAMLFFVEENHNGTSYVSIYHGPTESRIALEALHEAQRQLRGNPVNVPGAYIEARAFAEKAMPPISLWT